MNIRAMIVAVLLAVSARHGSGQVPTVYTPFTGGVSPNGPVNTIAKLDERIFFGGRFTEVGSFNSGTAAIDPNSGLVRAGFPIFKNLQAVAADGADGWFAVDRSLSYSPKPRDPMSLLHLRSDGSIITRRELNIQLQDTLSPANVAVSSLVLSGDTLYIGGEFEQVNGEVRRNLAAISVRTGAVLPWNPDVDKAVRRIVRSEDYIIALGAFSTIDGEPCPGLARLNAKTGELSQWASGVPTHMRNPAAMAVKNGILYTTNGGMEVESGTPTSWIPLPEKAVQDPYYFARVRDVAVDDERVYVAGEFTYMNGARRHGLAAFDLDNGQLLDWAPNALWQANTRLHIGWAEIGSVSVVNNMVFVAGEFIRFGDQAVNGIVGVDRVSGAIRSRPETMSPISPTFIGNDIVGGQNGTLFVRNRRGSIGHAPSSRTGLAEIGSSTGQLSGWSPNFISRSFDTTGEPWSISLDAIVPIVRVNSLAISNQRLYVGGLFDSVDGERRSRLAAFDLENNRLLPWNPMVIGRRVTSVVVANGAVFIAGEFWSVAGEPRRYIAAVDAVSGAILPWDPRANGTVTSMVVRNGRVYLGGTFDTVAGQPRNGFAIVSATTGEVVESGPHFVKGAEVSSMQVDDQRVYLSGIFLEPFTGVGSPVTIGGYSLENGSLEWRPRISDSFPDILAQAMVLDNDNLYVGGVWYTRYPALALFRFDIPTGQLSMVEPMTGPQVASGPPHVRALFVSGDTIYAGGSFTRLAEGFHMPYWSRFDPERISAVQDSPLRRSSLPIVVYPNPATSDIIVDCSGTTLPAVLQVIDMWGAVRHQQSVSVPYTVVSLKNMDAGAYAVRVGKRQASFVILQ